MFRPNRIGEHMLVDLQASATKNPITSANFTNVVGVPTVFDVQTDLATLQSPGSFTNLYVNVSGNWSLGFGESFAWGRFVDGTHENGLPIQYTVVGYMEAEVNRSLEGVSVALNIGELDSGSVSVDYNAQVNKVTNAVPLPCAIRKGDQSFSAYGAVNCVDGLFDGNGTSFSTQPVGAFWSIVNDDGVAVIIEYMRMSVSIYKYVGDIDTFDPTR